MKLLGAILTAAGFLLLGFPAAAQNGDAYTQAVLNYKTGNFPAARIAIDDALAANPDNVAIVILKSRILTELGDFDGARKTLESLNDNPHLTPADGDARTLAWGDICMRRRDFDGATKFYESLLARQPDNPDLKLKIVYSRVGANDLVTAAKFASELKPLDPDNPAYYFARAALAEATGKSAEADQEIETVRTIYGITVANRYLKTYLQVFAPRHEASVSSRAEPPATKASPAKPAQP